MAAGSRYIIGIDLGTSNCALSYIDTLDPEFGNKEATRLFKIPQLEALDKTIRSAVLPSFLYLPLPPERKKLLKTMALSSASAYEGFVSGQFSRNQTVLRPGRVISSAKSWLCHGGVDREAKILPWQSEEVLPAEKISPVEVTACYLAHLKNTWDKTFAKDQKEYALDKQAVTITVPASFDEAAQQLTLEAASLAGYQEEVMLLEEPQAAFYRWLEQHGKTLLKALPRLQDEQQTILICDVGGGTTDLSLLEISKVTGQEEIPEIRRIAVSDHILLGGDNIDLTIAHILAEKVGKSPGALSRRQWDQLVYQARDLKEGFLSGRSDSSEECLHYSIVSDGSNLFSSSLSGKISGVEVSELIFEGFYPGCKSDAKPAHKQAGLKEWGLPYAADSAVTRHLADFLRGREIDALLCNGGSLKPIFLQDRLVSLIQSWQPERKLSLLVNSDLDLAVARGAAYSGLMARRKQGRIIANYPRSVYLELEKDQGLERKLVCVLPQGFRAGESLRLEELKFQLLVDQPVRFQSFCSIHRPEDRAGDIVTLNDNDYHALPPIQTLLQYRRGMKKTAGSSLEIELEAALTEVGILHLYCVTADQEIGLRWELRFNLRKADSIESLGDKAKDGQDPEVPTALLKKAEEKISSFYGKRKGSSSAASPKGLIKELEKTLGKKRKDWNVALLRSLWEPLSAGITRRGRSRDHETAWLYLAGFLMRPGYGSELDALRMEELWRVYELGLSFKKERISVVQSWIMWRRVAGGLDHLQQERIFTDLKYHLEQRSSEDPEAFRLAGSLERAGLDKKIKLAELLVKRFLENKPSMPEHYFWTFGRLAGRVPLYSNLHCVIPPNYVENWMTKLLDLDWSDKRYCLFNGVASQVCRRTGDPERDLSSEVIERTLKKLNDLNAAEEHIRVLEKVQELDEKEQAKLFGEALPSGLKLSS